ncbi:hypothetical protein [Nocardiopsis xinjiangensis]|uniref:hypothetical protein n=1 Tax=Nocardiopsis xinjiangensis TaxID=124285 RepID=UPI00126948BC|nr:hypothetical protein [Nocardiopsis xinjiangensis]
MSTATLPDGMRQVLTAPRGRRFTRPGIPRTHQARMLAQMADNPRVRYRQLHGELPAWMNAQEERTPPRRQPRPATPTVPHPRTPDETSPGAQPPSRPRPSRPPVPVPPRRPGNHRKPRRRTGWILAGHTLAATAGACVSHLFGFLG